jgi:acyl-CoA dehydrogenase
MNFAPDPDQEAIADAVRSRCRDFDDGYWATCDENHQFPWDFYRSMAEGGWVGLTIPEKYGGGGRGIGDAAVLMQEIAASGAAMNGCSALHTTVFGLEPVVRHGNDRLKHTILPAAADGSLHVAFGVTEPTAGTDTSKIQTRAVRDGDAWRISGQKIWTTKAMEADIVLLLARSSPADASPLEGLSLFIVDMNAPGVTRRPIPKAGRNAVASCETFYDDVQVEPWRLVGDEGSGFRHLLAGLNPERVLIAAEAIGIGRAALRRAVSYAKEREVFDRPIGSNQAISHPLADAYARLEAAWTLTLLAGWKYDSGQPCGAEANTAKYLAAEAGYLAADRAMQTHGGLGYAEEYHVARYWREARIMRIAPVSQEMTLNFLAQKVLGLPRSY